MKIAIIGCPGSGKSTLAEKLYAITHIPLYHLDQYFWQPGWQRPDRAVFEKVHHDLCDKQESWIIEGMAIRHVAYRIEKADVIIFLDVSLWRCLYRIFKRAIMGYGTIRISSAPGCPERMPSWEFLQYVWHFNRKHTPFIAVFLAEYKKQKKIFVIKNDSELDVCIEHFKAQYNQD